MKRVLNADRPPPLIVGLGATGLSCARYFQRCGQPCAVVDSRPQPPGLVALQREQPDLEVLVGAIPAARLRRAGRLIVSPGIALQQPAVAAASAAGVPVCGDIDLFMEAASAPVVGITGSNGKSTVTALLGQMATLAGKRVATGGNLGTPALDLLADAVELYVLELSSFQLERAGELGLQLACVLNLSADHLDRHGAMPAYHQAKQRIFRGCRALVYNRDDPLSRPLQADRLPALSFGLGEPDLADFGLRRIDDELWLCRGFERLLPAAELALIGQHNVANALAALALGQALALPLAARLQALREFAGLPHRSQWVADCNGVRYINDSKATNPAAAGAALRGLGGQSPLVLIAGGQGKDADFGELCQLIAAHCKAVVLLGAAAPLLARDLQGLLPTRTVATMEEAVRAATALATAGDCVLLAPACASFDMFDSFAERGERFAEAVQALAGGAAT